MQINIILTKEIDDTDQGKDFYEQIKLLLKDHVDCRIQGSVTNNLAIEEL